MQKVAQGFRAAGVACGQKKKGGLDLALILSDRPCNAAAVFTQNRFRAAPVMVSQHALEANGNRNVGGLVINSGCANACTGLKGLADAQEMGRLASAANTAVPNSATMVMSTGVIGQHLKMECISKGISEAAAELQESAAGWENAARAVMTTDTWHKFVSRSVQLPGVSAPVTLTGIAKGAGMIHPNMATMLGIIATDANVHPKLLKHAVKYSADRSFNSVTIDGDTSTNDSFMILANGAAMDKELSEESDPGYQALLKEITTTAQQLAQMLIRDGEGATKFITVTVEEAQDYEQARKAACAISTSSLVKTAMFGKDANWGRIVCALGYSGAQFKPENVHLWMSSKDSATGQKVDELHLFKNGAPFEIDEDRAARILAHSDIDLRLKIGENPTTEPATYWTTDLSYDYVKINADYRT